MDENAKYMRMKTTLIFIFLTLFSLAFVSALGVDIPIPAYNNNTANVNNSQYLRGYTPFNLPYLTSFTESDPIFTSWLTGTYFVPYTGATGDVDILPYDFKASRIEATGDLQGKDIIGETLNVPDIPHYGDGVSNFNNDIPYLVSGDVMNFNSGLIYSDANANVFFPKNITANLVKTTDLTISNNLTVNRILAGGASTFPTWAGGTSALTVYNTNAYTFVQQLMNSGGLVSFQLDNAQLQSQFYKNTRKSPFDSPSITFLADLDTGINSYAANELDLVAGAELVINITTTKIRLNKLMELTTIVLPACSAGLKNNIGANATGTYGCNGTNWVLIF